MSVGLLIITHNGVGRTLLKTAFDMLEAQPMQALTFEIDLSSDIEQSVEIATTYIQQCDQGHGVLILTDVYGSTPSNVAALLLEQCQACVVSGLNLPMLIRVLNYPKLDLRALAKKAESGGKDGILCLENL